MKVRVPWLQMNDKYEFTGFDSEGLPNFRYKRKLSACKDMPIPKPFTLHFEEEEIQDEP